MSEKRKGEHRGRHRWNSVARSIVQDRNLRLERQRRKEDKKKKPQK